MHFSMNWLIALSFQQNQKIITEQSAYIKASILATFQAVLP
jgi:hypothetical protein